MDAGITGPILVIPGGSREANALAQAWHAAAVCQPASAAQGEATGAAGFGGLRAPLLLKCGGKELCHAMYELGSVRSERDAHAHAGANRAE